jgi:Carboxypeptidase regulatory-like domain
MSLALMTVSFALLIQPQYVQPPIMNARVAGRVVAAGSSAPVAGALVMLLPVGQPFPPGAMAPPQALTDANGEFILERVWAGRFRVQIRKSGFAPSGSVLDGQTLDIGAGQTMTGLTFTLTRGGVIAGRILDAGGEPAAEIMVHALRQTTGDTGPSSRGASTMQMAQTNDLGEFRLTGLPEGHYVIIATPQPQAPFAQVSSAVGTVPAPTYYPGTTDPQTAHIIDLAAGQTIDSVQFSIAAVQAHQVSGTVVDEAGSPQAGAIVTLMGDPRPDGLLLPMTGRADETGRFRIAGVVAGTYRAMVTIPGVGSVESGSGGIGAVVGGEFVGAIGGPVAGGVAVTPTGGIAWSPGPVRNQGPPPVEVTVDNADVTGVRLVLPVRRH